MGGSAKYRAAKKIKTNQNSRSLNVTGQKHFPVEANLRIKVKTREDAVREFRNSHVNSDHERAYAIDDQGYVHQYAEGGKDFVDIKYPKNGHVIHNHPDGEGEHLSVDDLRVFASKELKSLTASSKRNDYVIERGTHFKKQEFMNALYTAKINWDDTDSVHNWLLDNAYKYGYRYTRKVYNNSGKVVKETKSLSVKRSDRKKYGL